MPIMKPEIQKVLRAAGLIKSEAPPETNFSGHLDLAGLNEEAIAQQLANLAMGAESDQTRLRAIENAMKAKSLLKEDRAASIPSFSIVIQNSGGPGIPLSSPTQNILFPRPALSSNTTLNEKEENLVDRNSPEAA